MNKKVMIIGGGGHAKVIADIVKKTGDEVIGFLDDNTEIQGNTIFDGKNVLGTTEKINEYLDCYFIIGIGSNRIRKIINDKFKNLKWYTAIHPNAIISNEVEIGEGTAIMGGAVINPGTRIGKHCIVNTGATLDHDNIIENYVHISPGAHLAGTVTIKESTWICTGTNIINNITIEKNNIIGAGTTVIRNITDTNGVYVGTPAQKIK